MGEDDPIEREVNDAVGRIWGNLSVIFQGSLDMIPQSEGSSVIFLRPTPGNRDQDTHFIPTPHLWTLFEKQRTKLKNDEIRKMAFSLSSHSYTRAGAGWLHETSVHKRLSTEGAALTITRGPTEQHIQPSTHIIPGALASLKDVGSNDSFYWIPSMANFPGIDSILGDIDGNVYTIQATIADTHTSPVQGIKRVWEQFRPEIRTSRTWHFVIITNSQNAADKYVEVFSKQLRELTLGRGHTPVQVWACAL
jgi:hypothetical protein